MLLELSKEMESILGAVEFGRGIKELDALLREGDVFKVCGDLGFGVCWFLCGHNQFMKKRYAWMTL